MEKIVNDVSCIVDNAEYDLGNDISWDDGVAHCHNLGMRLCSHLDYCPNGGFEAPSGGPRQGEQWAPTEDDPNSWVSIGDYEQSSRLCKLHHNVPGLEADDLWPKWGTKSSNSSWLGLGFGFG